MEDKACEDRLPDLVDLLKDHQRNVHKADSYEYPTKALWHLAADTAAERSPRLVGGCPHHPGRLRIREEHGTEHTVDELSGSMEKKIMGD